MFEDDNRVAMSEALALFDRFLDKLHSVNLIRLADDDVLDLAREIETRTRQLPSVEHALVNEMQQRQLASERGCISTGTLLVQLLRLHPGEASARVRAAADLGPRRALTGEPLPPIFETTAAASASGAISARHAAIITRTIDKLPHTVAAELDSTVEGILVEQARQLDPRTLALFARDLCARLDPDGILADERDRARRRELTVQQRPDGSSQVRGELDAICTEAFLTVLDTLARPTPADDGERDTRTPGQRRHDALRDALLTLIRSGELPDSGGITTTILLTMTADQIQTGAGVVRTGHGGLVTAQQALSLLGDSQLIPVQFGKLKQIEAYGSTHRLFTANQRLAMTARDGGCSFPGCTVPPARCEAHHITDYALTRRTRVDDGTLLCGRHHRDHPTLGWTCHMKDGIPHWTPPAWIDPQQTPQRNRMHHPELV